MRKPSTRKAMKYEKIQLVLERPFWGGSPWELVAVFTSEDGRAARERAERWAEPGRLHGDPANPAQYKVVGAKAAPFLSGTQVVVNPDLI